MNLAKFSTLHIAILQNVPKFFLIYIASVTFTFLFTRNRILQNVRDKLQYQSVGNKSSTVKYKRVSCQFYKQQQSDFLRL